MRKLIEYFIRYHVAVNVVVISFALFGIVGAKALKSSFFPLTDSKNIAITIANFPNRYGTFNCIEARGRSSNNSICY